MGQLHQLLGFKEALEVPHLPDTNGHKDEGLQNGPPQHPLVGAFTGLPEALLSPLWGKTKSECELAGFARMAGVLACKESHYLGILYPQQSDGFRQYNHFS